MNSGQGEILKQIIDKIEDLTCSDADVTEFSDLDKELVVKLRLTIPKN